jgi:hypothetical protein
MAVAGLMTKSVASALNLDRPRDSPGADIVAATSLQEAHDRNRKRNKKSRTHPYPYLGKTSAHPPTSVLGYSEPINLAGRALERLFGRQACSWELVPKQLVMKDILREERTKVWGLLPVTRFPLVATAKRDDSRRTFSAALRSTSRLPNSLAALISIARSGCRID